MHLVLPVRNDRGDASTPGAVGDERGLRSAAPDLHTEHDVVGGGLLGGGRDLRVVGREIGRARGAVRQHL